MGVILTLRDEIESIITGMAGVTYLRAKEDEANKAINKMKVTNCLAVHIDLTTVSANRSIGNYIYKVIPTQILFVYKNTRIDDKTYNVDILIDNADMKADEFYDLLIQGAVIDSLAELPGYETHRLEAYKRFDAIVSGVLFECDVPVPRYTRYCI